MAPGGKTNAVRLRPDTRIQELDAIRGLAILLVMVHHYSEALLDTATGPATALALPWLQLGRSGVDLFFVLSGFLIGGILMDARESSNYYKTFYFRRFYRILPLYFIYLLVFCAGGYLTTHVGTASRWAGTFHGDLPFWSYAVFLQNIFMAHTGGFGASWGRVTWSLAVEEQFYLLLPFVIRRFDPKALVKVVAAAVVAAPLFRTALYFYGYKGVAPYALLPCRADALGLGVLVAMACRNPQAWKWITARRRYTTVAFSFLLCGAAVLTKYPMGTLPMQTAGYSVLAGLYACVLLLAIHNPGPGFRVMFRNATLAKVGIYAYALYLFHDGIHLVLCNLVYAGPPAAADWRYAGLTAVSILLTFCVAAFSWWALEEPLIRHARTKFRYDVPRRATTVVNTATAQAS
jgi:peptidoglycan/LPS O-acetylase OafA/YrhL